jgi:alpha-1,3-glucan synthase
MNSSTPFSLKEHDAVRKSDRQYLDFDFTNVYNDTYRYSRFWGDDGLPVVFDTRGGRF